MRLQAAALTFFMFATCLVAPLAHAQRTSSATTLNLNATNTIQFPQDFNPYETLGVDLGTNDRDIKSAYDQLHDYYFHEALDPKGPQHRELVNKYLAVEQAYQLIGTLNGRLIWQKTDAMIKSLNKLGVTVMNPDVLHARNLEEASAPLAAPTEAIDLEKNPEKLGLAIRALKRATETTSKIKGVAKDVIKTAPGKAVEVGVPFTVNNAGFIFGSAAKLIAECIVRSDKAFCGAVSDTLTDVNGWLGIGAFSLGSTTSTGLINGGLWTASKVSGVGNIAINDHLGMYLGMAGGSFVDHFFSKFWGSRDRVDASYGFTEWRRVSEEYHARGVDLAADQALLQITKDPKKIAELNAKIADNQAVRQKDSAQIAVYKQGMWNHVGAAYAAMKKMAPGEWNSMLNSTVQMTVSSIVLSAVVEPLMTATRQGLWSKAKSLFGSKKAGDTTMAEINAGSEQVLSERMADNIEIMLGKKPVPEAIMTEEMATRLEMALNKKVEEVVAQEIKKKGIGTIAKSVLGNDVLTGLVLSAWNAIKFLTINDLIGEQYNRFAMSRDLDSKLTTALLPIQQHLNAFLADPQDREDIFSELSTALDNYRKVWSDYREEVILDGFNYHYHYWKNRFIQEEQEFYRLKNWLEWISNGSDLQDTTFVDNGGANGVRWHVPEQFRSQFQDEYNSFLITFKDELWKCGAGTKNPNCDVSLWTPIEKTTVKDAVKSFLDSKRTDLDALEQLDMDSLQWSLAGMVQGAFFDSTPSIAARLSLRSVPGNLNSSYDFEFEDLRKRFVTTFYTQTDNSDFVRGIEALFASNQPSGDVYGQIKSTLDAMASSKLVVKFNPPGEAKYPAYDRGQRTTIMAIEFLKNFYYIISEKEALPNRAKMITTELPRSDRDLQQDAPQDPLTPSPVDVALRRTQDLRVIVPAAGSKTAPVIIKKDN